jgi:hypothetical protein
VRIVTNIDTSKLRKPEQIARSARAFLYATALVNKYYVELGLLPPLERAGVRFRNEPWRGKFEEFADGLTVLKRGWGDCDDLIPYVLGWLWAHGERGARIRIYWRINRRTKTPKFHVELRRADGRIEDWSRYLGMPGRRAA